MGLENAILQNRRQMHWTTVALLRMLLMGLDENAILQNRRRTRWTILWYCGCCSWVWKTQSCKTDRSDHVENPPRKSVSNENLLPRPNNQMLHAGITFILELLLVLVPEEPLLDVAPGTDVARGTDINSELVASSSSSNPLPSRAPRTNTDLPLLSHSPEHCSTKSPPLRVRQRASYAETQFRVVRDRKGRDRSEGAPGASYSEKRFRSRDSSLLDARILLAGRENLQQNPFR